MNNTTKGNTINTIQAYAGNPSTLGVSKNATHISVVGSGEGLVTIKLYKFTQTKGSQTITVIKDVPIQAEAEAMMLEHTS